MSTYIFVHGSLSGGWCWSKVKKILESKGHRVITPDLPGHGAESTIPPVSVTMESYVTFARNLIESMGEKVILVGHSLGGAILTKVLDDLEIDIVDKVYFISSLIPQNGDIIGNLLKEDTGSELSKAFNLNKETMTIELVFETAREIYYNGCSDEDFAFARELIRPQSIIPFSTPIELHHKKAIRSIGVVTNKDRSLSPLYQRKMYLQAGFEIVSIDTGHAPFFSKPDELAGILLAERN